MSQLLHAQHPPGPHHLAALGRRGSSARLERNAKMATGKGATLQRLSELFALLHFVTRGLHAIETVHMVDFCGQVIKDDGMIVNSHAESRKYYFVAIGTDCRLTMQASSPKDKVQFQFRFFLVYSLLRMSAGLLPTPAVPPPLNDTRTSALSDSSRLGMKGAEGLEAPDPCNAGSYLQFYDGSDRTAPALGPPLCGKSIPRPVLSTGNYLTLRLVTRGQQPRVDFVGDFTSFRLGFNSSACNDEPYFHCWNGKCIPTSLVCDKRNVDNCGDGSDQSPRPPAKCPGLSSQSPPGHPASTTTRTVARVVPSSSLHLATTGNLQPFSPDTIIQQGSGADKTTYTSLLALYIILGLIVSMALLFWCCWSPGWFIWRVSACRAIPCCNSFCASCHLCTRSCGWKDKSRPGKVTPQDTANVPATSLSPHSEITSPS